MPTIDIQIRRFSVVSERPFEAVESAVHGDHWSCKHQRVLRRSGAGQVVAFTVPQK